MDIKGNKVVLYVQNYNIYVSNCTAVKTINIDLENNICTEDIQVTNN